MLGRRWPNTLATDLAWSFELQMLLSRPMHHAAPTMCSVDVRLHGFKEIDKETPFPWSARFVVTGLQLVNKTKRPKTLLLVAHDVDVVFASL